MSTQASQTKETSEVLINSIHQGIIESFSQLFERVRFRGYDTVNESFEGIAVIISFVGDLPCSLIMTFAPETAVAMTCHFAGFEISYESEDMIDATGELVNIAAGPISASLVAAGIQAHMSLPTVLCGTGIEMMLPGHSPITRLHYACPQGSFHAKILTPMP